MSGQSRRIAGIVDVARRAGVSASTVSRFFNAPDKVGAKAQARIESAVRELGYVRNRVAGSLHNRPSGAIGLLVPTVDNAIFAEMIEAALEEHPGAQVVVKTHPDVAGKKRGYLPPEARERVQWVGQDVNPHTLLEAIKSVHMVQVFTHNG